MTLAGITITRALDVRTAARRFYPNNISMQRKWVAAWRWAPGPRVPVGRRVPSDVAAQPINGAVVGALTYLRARNLRT